MRAIQSEDDPMTDVDHSKDPEWEHSPEKLEMEMCATIRADKISQSEAANLVDLYDRYRSINLNMFSKDTERGFLELENCNTKSPMAYHTFWVNLTVHFIKMYEKLLTIILGFSTERARAFLSNNETSMDSVVVMKHCNQDL